MLRNNILFSLLFILVFVNILIIVLLFTSSFKKGPSGAIGLRGPQGPPPDNPPENIQIWKFTNGVNGVITIINDFVVNSVSSEMFWVDNQSGSQKNIKLYDKNWSQGEFCIITCMDSGNSIVVISDQNKQGALYYPNLNVTINSGETQVFVFDDKETIYNYPIRKINF